MPDKPLVLLHGEIKRPPLSEAVRLTKLAFSSALLQRGLLLSMPHSRPMPSINRHCRELRIQDADHQLCKRRLRRYNLDVKKAR